MATRHDEAAGTEHRRRTQDRANVVRICNLVEHDQRSPIRRRREFIPIRLGKGLCFERRSLMHGIGSEQPVEVARDDPFDRCFDRAHGFPDTAFRVLRQEQAQDAPRWVSERGFHGVKPEEADDVIFAPCGMIGGGRSARGGIWLA